MQSSKVVATNVALTRSLYKMQALSISVENAHFYAYHGVFEQEQVVGNEFVVSVTVSLPASDELINDELSDTISYVDIYDIISDLRVQSYDLFLN